MNIINSNDHTRDLGITMPGDCSFSLTCILCKILEHFINRHILDHLDEHRILVDAQHGFRRGSCETQLILTCHDLAKVVNDSGQVDMLVLDVAKAFDTVVAHKLLLWKLESYGIDGNLYGWIQSFLEGRTQIVAENIPTDLCTDTTAGIKANMQVLSLSPTLQET